MNQNKVAARLRRGAVAALAAIAMSGCGSKGGVTVTGILQDPSMYVDTSSTLVGRLNGTFSLHVSLGPGASEGTDVSIGLGNFTLVDAVSQTPITVLKLMATPEGPYHLEPGKSLDALFTVNDKGPGQLLSKDEQTFLCKSTTTPAISGSISDDNGSLPLNSPKFTIRCP
ncbi:MAG: hypothetical protein ABW133_12640 [Polyangiaceae bacterium]